MNNVGLLKLDFSILFQFPSLKYLSCGYNTFVISPMEKSQALQLLKKIKVQALDLSGIYQQVTPFNFHRMYLTQSLDGFPTLPEQISIPTDYKEHKVK